MAQQTTTRAVVGAQGGSVQQRYTATIHDELERLDARLHSAITSLREQTDVLIGSQPMGEGGNLSPKASGTIHEITDKVASLHLALDILFQEIDRVGRL